MQLYKSRGFSDFFQDTFAFINQNGKHFFKHYFIINGVFLLILIGIGYLFTKFYTNVVFGGFLGGNQSTTVLDNYINDHLGLFIVIMLIFIFVAIIAAMVSYVFPAIYLKLYVAHDGYPFNSTQIINVYKQNIGKLIIYLICSMLLGIPLLIVFFVVAFILAITIIGLLAIPLLFGAFMLFYIMTLMEYLEHKRGIWESFRYSWELLKSKFWAAAGCVGLFYLISYIIQNVINIIPYLFGMASLFTTIETGGPGNDDLDTTMTIILLAVFFLSFLVSAFLNTIVQLNQGIIFYSLKEDLENINTKSIIDQIGSGE
ncbi:hypothetical protein [Aestuariivivens sediminis]|uniref:hypothetical protein n=1 Tax=Aestuariivivens sediminis TaxID=2913557 RepID=UPI001F59D73B|nr:hypothetical protein [Aestuariivivens sediminis]